MWTKLQHRLQQRRLESMIRARLTVDSAQSVIIKHQQKDYLNFCSNDYLGLANHPKMIEVVKKEASEFGVGSGASHLIVGHTHHHHQLEEELAEFCEQPRAILFSTGYMANLGVLTSLFDKDDLILQDKLNHASLIDGGLSSPAQMLRYGHNDISSLTRQIQKTAQSKLVVTDGVFSMDGDIAPLVRIKDVCQRNSAQLMIDDAHGFAVLGDNGRGTAEHHQLATGAIDIYMATLGKAAGGFGAFVTGSELLIESLIQFARSYIYTTAMPSVIAAANRMGLQLIQQEAWRRQKLKENIAYFRLLATQQSLPLSDSQTAIQPIVLGDNHLVVKVSEQLRACGIMVLAIRPPTVPVGSARLRVTLSAEHSQEHIEQLVEALSSIISQLE